MPILDSEHNFSKILSSTRTVRYSFTIAEHDGTTNTSMVKRSTNNPPWLQSYASLSTILAVSLAAASLFRLCLWSAWQIRKTYCLNNEVQGWFRRPNTTFARWKKHISIAPIFRSRHVSGIGLSSETVSYRLLPTRLQALFMLPYIGLNLTLMALSVSWSANRVAILEQLRIQTGELAVQNIVFTFLFISRSNPVMWLINCDREDLLFLHIWFGTVAVAQSLAHGAFWIAVKLLTGGPHGLQASRIVCEYLALGALVLLLISSWYPIRRTFVKVFKFLHLVMTVVFLVGLYFHLKSTTYRAFVISTIGIWSFERALRLFRILWRNAGNGGTTAVVERLPGELELRITIRVARPCRAVAGTYVRLYIPSISLWTSHPFAVAWDNVPLKQDLNSGQMRLKEKKKLQYDIKRKRIAEEDLYGPQTITVLVRPRNGFTAELARKIKRSNGTLELSAWVEGPYTNTNTSFSSHGHVILVAGGIGIAAQLARITELLIARAQGLAAVRRIILVWCVRHEGDVEVIDPFLEKLAMSTIWRGILEMHIYLTDDDSTTPTFSGTYGNYGTYNTAPNFLSGFNFETEPHYEGESTLIDDGARNTFRQSFCEASLDLLTIHHGRPDLDQMLDREIGQQIGAMMISVCGPPSMSNEMRTLAKDNQGCGNIDFVEEHFGI
ncbi:hypothetical protein BT63DRAFT_167162 [Microthyrium microscopicum]|uniref:FAD-binding FR-type domain-containing protein n=1 Tax=Microthyrium microscopicum TaxID=703497 RepID=A0A6A6UNE7_9PEZI|nr:hypothetical protein BT63DRAFT_167162 [Microthyrium microscopicum]